MATCLGGGTANPKTAQRWVICKAVKDDHFVLLIGDATEQASTVSRRYGHHDVRGACTVLTVEGKELILKGSSVDVGVNAGIPKQILAPIADEMMKAYNVKSIRNESLNQDNFRYD